ncbi:ClpX C4-type zinc finger protein [Pseudobacillus sp. FSL P4-0506]|uniref:ClpX C4-type zinc finger protein n=1 Tax=Pseudobacillus sp. FSL P4-0506 TaxID=2921576 RepID=UPI0030FD109B
MCTYDSIEKNSIAHTVNNTQPLDSCSFCLRSKEEKIRKLAIGPGVSICHECLEFGAEVIKSHSAVI